MSRCGGRAGRAVCCGAVNCCKWCGGSDLWPPLCCLLQVKSNTFNLEANLTLLRNYQFQPSAAKTPVIAKARPSVHCQAAGYLLLYI